MKNIHCFGYCALLVFVLSGCSNTYDRFNLNRPTQPAPLKTPTGFLGAKGQGYTLEQYEADVRLYRRTLEFSVGISAATDIKYDIDSGSYVAVPAPVVANTDTVIYLNRPIRSALDTPGATQSYSVTSTDRRGKEVTSTENWETIKISKDDASDAAAQLRNEILGNLMLEIDTRYSEYVAVLSAGRALSNTGLDMLALSTSAAATAFSPASTKTILSALSTSTQGFQTSVDENFFREQTMEVLLAQMDVSREPIRAKIIAGMEAAVGKFPLEEGLAELSDYFQAGTLPQALADLARSIDDQGKVKLSSLVESKTDYIALGRSAFGVEAVQKEMIPQFANIGIRLAALSAEPTLKKDTAAQKILEELKVEGAATKQYSDLETYFSEVASVDSSKLIAFIAAFDQHVQ